MSAESGLSTFRDANGLWENYPVARVATHEGWLQDPEYVNDFYNMMRKKLVKAEPNEGHRLVAGLERWYDVSVVTQNVDNLHEAAGSSKVIHLHGELMKVCSSRDTENPNCWRTMAAPDLEVKPGEKAADGSLLRPYIVFFGEAVPNIEPAAMLARDADIFIIIGTSLNVYPAAGLVQYVKPDTPIYLIDPQPVMAAGRRNVHHIQAGASEGMRILTERLMPADDKQDRLTESQKHITTPNTQA